MSRFVFWLTLFAAISCASPSAPTAPPAAPELTGFWNVTHIGKQAVIEGSQCHLEFHADGTLSGRASVNQVAGSFTLEGDALSFSPLATTKRMGPPPLMQQEQALLEALSKVTRVSRHDAALEFFAADDSALIRARLDTR